MERASVLECGSALPLWEWRSEIPQTLEFDAAVTTEVLATVLPVT